MKLSVPEVVTGEPVMAKMPDELAPFTLSPTLVTVPEPPAAGALPMVASSQLVQS